MRAADAAIGHLLPGPSSDTDLRLSVGEAPRRRGASARDGQTELGQIPAADGEAAKQNFMHRVAHLAEAQEVPDDPSVKTDLDGTKQGMSGVAVLDAAQVKPDGQVEEAVFCAYALSIKFEK